MNAASTPFQAPGALVEDAGGAAGCRVSFSARRPSRWRRREAAGSGGTACRLLCLTVLFIARSAAAPGDFDTSFGGGGGTTVSFTADDDFGYGVALQTDGKILMAGGSAAGDYSVLRLLANGNPDPDFGSGGKFVHSFGLFELARGVAQVSGGKILVGGSGLVGGGSRDFAVLRLLPGGTLDPDYGTGGLVTTDINGGFNETVNGMAVDGGGRAVLAGFHRSNVALVRYTSTGGLDGSFGTGGKVFASTGTATQQANAVAVQGDGKIVICGQSQTGSNTDILVARYLENGSPDPNFGTGGKTLTPVGAGTTSDVANAVVVLADEKILVAGTSGAGFALLRYTSGGVLDSDFGTGGSTTVEFGGATSFGYGLAVQSDGRILVGGTVNFNDRDYFALLRFTSGGDLDTGFGTGGSVITALTGGSDSGRAVAVQADGKILVAGWAGTVNAKDFGIVRYESATVLTLAQWRQQYFGNPANSGNGADDFDFDKDGLINILEYAFGQDPTKGNSCAVPVGQVAGGNFVSSYSASTTTGISYAAEWSPTMTGGTWMPITDTGSGTLHTFSVPMAGRTKICLRWKITAP